MEKTALISVIIPIYNCEKVLKRCVESVINQTYKNIEIILVDDGSQDNSLKICKEYEANNKNVLVISQKNSGPSSARNLGLKNANGEYIGFVDSDDYIDSEMFQKLYVSCTTNAADISICNYIKEYDENKLIHNEKIENCTCSGKKACLDFLLKSQVNWGIWNKLYKASLIKEKNILFDQKLRIGEDGLFNFNIIDNNSDIKISYLCEELYHYSVINTAKNDQKYSDKINDYFVH